MIQEGGVAARSRRGCCEVAAAHQSMCDDAGARAECDRILAGLRCSHAAVGGQMGKPLIIDFEQKSSGNVISIGGQDECPALGFAVEKYRGGAQVKEQLRKKSDQLSVSAPLIVASCAISLRLQHSDVRRRTQQLHLLVAGVPDKHGDERHPAIGIRTGNMLATAERSRRFSNNGVGLMPWM